MCHGTLDLPLEFEVFFFFYYYQFGMNQCIYLNFVICSVFICKLILLCYFLRKCLAEFLLIVERRRKKSLHLHISACYYYYYF